MTATVDELARDVWRIDVRNYQSTLVRAEHGCLLIDCHGADRVDEVLAAAREASGGLPVHTLVYTHHHVDHVGAAQRVVDAAAADGRALEIRCTPACARAIERHGDRVPAPTRPLTGDVGRFFFGDHAVRFGTAPGHCADNTWFLLEEARVLHCADVVHPGGLEFEAFGLAQDLVEYEADLRFLHGLEWDVLVAGHKGLGRPDDVAFVLEYLGAVRAAIVAAWDRVAHLPLPPGQTLSGRRDAVVAEAVEALRPAWGHWPQFADAAWSHVNAAFWDVAFLHGP